MFVRHSCRRARQNPSSRQNAESRYRDASDDVARIDGFQADLDACALEMILIASRRKSLRRRRMPPDGRSWNAPSVPDQPSATTMTVPASAVAARQNVSGRRALRNQAEADLAVHQHREAATNRVAAHQFSRAVARAGLGVGRVSRRFGHRRFDQMSAQRHVVVDGLRNADDADPRPPRTSFSPPAAHPQRPSPPIATGSDLRDLSVLTIRRIWWPKRNRGRSAVLVNAANDSSQSWRVPIAPEAF